MRDFFLRLTVIITSGMLIAVIFTVMTESIPIGIATHLIWVVSNRRHVIREEKSNVHD